MRRLAISLLCACALAGCGNSAARPPDVSTPSSPRAYVPASYPAAGVRFDYPANWTITSGQPPLVSTVVSGQATVAVWRYARTEPLPVGPLALARARIALIRAARRRDRTLRVRSARVRRLHGSPAIVLFGSESVGGQRRSVRSVHVFFAAHEVVVDAFAPASQFRRVDRSVFGPLVASLRLSGGSGALGP